MHFNKSLFYKLCLKIKLGHLKFESKQCLEDSNCRGKLNCKSIISYHLKLKRIISKDNNDPSKTNKVEKNKRQKSRKSKFVC